MRPMAVAETHHQQPKPQQQEEDEDTDAPPPPPPDSTIVITSAAPPLQPPPPPPPPEPASAPLPADLVATASALGLDSIASPLIVAAKAASPLQPEASKRRAAEYAMVPRQGKGE